MPNINSDLSYANEAEGVLAPKDEEAPSAASVKKTVRKPRTSSAVKKDSSSGAGTKSTSTAKKKTSVKSGTGNTDAAPISEGGYAEAVAASVTNDTEQKAADALEIQATNQEATEPVSVQAAEQESIPDTKITAQMQPTEAQGGEPSSMQGTQAASEERAAPSESIETNDMHAPEEVPNMQAAEGISDETGSDIPSSYDCEHTVFVTEPISDSEYENDQLSVVFPAEAEDKDAATEGGEAVAEDNESGDGTDENQLSIDFEGANEVLAKKDEKASADKYDPEHPRRVDWIFDLAELFIFSLVAVLLFTTFFFRHSLVVGTSMEATLYENEHLIISDLFYTPERGDIVVCDTSAIPMFDYSSEKAIVKRVIGVAGDHVEVDIYGTVRINGQLLIEDYVYIDGYRYYDEVDIVVPEGEVFVMGDHRNNSTDSRSFGTVKEDAIVGKVLFRFFPFDKFGKIE